MVRVEVARRKPWFLQGEGQRTGRTHPGTQLTQIFPHSPLKKIHGGGEAHKIILRKQLPPSKQPPP